MKSKPFYMSLIVLISTSAGIGLLSSTAELSSGQHFPKDSTFIDKIAFYSDRFGNREICLINADGTEFQRLTNNTAHDECPSFSPDGRKIAFSSNRDGNYEIYIMNSDGTDQQRLTYSPENDDHADWSPDGIKIAFSRYTDQSHSNIFVMNADGSNVQQITSNSDENMRPDWSPDGTRILFNTNKDGNYEIYLMNADGSNQQRLTNTTAFEIFPQLSHEGNQIIYARIVMNPFYGEVHLLNLDDSSDVALTQNSRSENPVWSSDGKQIAFQTSRDGNFEIYVMNADGSNQQRLTNHSSWDGWPSWGKIQTSTSIKDGYDEFPKDFQLHQNYPNPFNPSTKIKFIIPSVETSRQDVFTTMKVYDVLGNEITTLVNEEKPAGIYEVYFNYTDLPSGIYLYKLQANNNSLIKKMVLLK